MKKVEVELFSDATNAAIVRVPGRAFPGMVIQGDTLKIMLAEIEEIHAMAKGREMPELESAIICLRDDFSSRLTAYEQD